MPKQNLPEKVAELWGWLLIVIAFVGVGIGTAFSTVYFLPGTLGEGIGVLFGCLIVIRGIRLATKQYKGKGTMHVISRTSASPDLDAANEEEKNSCISRNG